MDSYGYPYPPPFQQMRPPDGHYPDHGDGFGEFYGLSPLNEDLGRRPSRSKQRARKTRSRTVSNSKSRSRTREGGRSRERERSRQRSRSQTRTRSRSRSRSRSLSGSRTQQKELKFKEPGFLDAFRVLYLIPSKHKKSTPKYLATQKHRDRVQEFLKADGLGSKHWFFYPRNHSRSGSAVPEVTPSRESCDQRVKVDGDFFRKYRKSKKVASDAPIAKLKRWELVFYKKLGFVQAV